MSLAQARADRLTASPQRALLCCMLVGCHISHEATSVMATRQAPHIVDRRDGLLTGSKTLSEAAVHRSD